MQTKLIPILLLCAGLTGSASAGVVLSPLNPTLVDDTYSSLNANNQAEIDFVNDTKFSVDVYWINYSGDRVLYYPDLGPGMSYDQQTFLTHPWLIVESGTGGTTAQGTGALIDAFLPVTANPTYDAANSDIAYIKTQTVPDAPSLLVPLTALAAIVGFRRKFATVA